MNTGTSINTLFIIKSRYIFLKCNTYHDQLGFILGSQQIITVNYQYKGKNNRCKNQAFGKIYHCLMIKNNPQKTRYTNKYFQTHAGYQQKSNKINGDQIYNDFSLRSGIK